MPEISAAYEIEFYIDIYYLHAGVCENLFAGKIQPSL
jgi:hypothetical protein